MLAPNWPLYCLPCTNLTILPNDTAARMTIKCKSDWVTHNLTTTRIPVLLGHLTALRMKFTSPRRLAAWGLCSLPCLTWPLGLALCISHAGVSGFHGPVARPLDTGPFFIWMLLPGTHNTSLHLVNSNSFLRSQLKHDLSRMSLRGPPVQLWSPSYKLSQFSCISPSQWAIIHVLV